MNVRCPKCLFAKDIDPAKIPAETLTVKCPQCGERFGFKKNPPQTESTVIYPLTVERARTASPPAEKTAAAPYKLSFHGKGGTLIGLYIVNIFLTLITFGVYFFWGRVKIRRYLYSQTELAGERFNYTGSGRELFIGWLKAMLIVFVFFGIPQILSIYVNRMLYLLIYPPLFFFMPFAMVNARRYRMSRSYWHGIRFSFTGRVWDCIKIYFLAYLLTILTLGVYLSFFHVKLQAFWRAETRFGNIPFQYTGKGRDLLFPFIFAIPLIILTLGVYYFWFKAKIHRYDWEHTTFDNVRFHSTVTGFRLFKYYLGNLFIILFTLGIGYPWVVARKVRFIAENLAIEGAVDFEKIRQTMAKATATGEGLFEQFDLDLGLGI